MANLTRDQLENRVQRTLECNRKEAQDAVMAVTAGLFDMLNGAGNGDSFIMRDFGTFKISVRKARPGRNPKTGEKIQIPAKRVLKFTISKVAWNGEV